MTEQPKDQPKSDGESTPMSDAALDKVAGGFGGFSASDYCSAHESYWPCQGTGTHTYNQLAT